MVEQGHDVDTDGPVTRAGPADDVRPARRTLADQLLDGAGSGILAHDDQGVIRFVNATASALLPNLRVGELLVGALDPRAVDPADGARPRAHAPCEVELTAGGSRLHARRHVLSDGWAAWYVDDVTEQHGRLDTLLVERSRSRFLASASGKLGLSLHPGRTARTVVELAVAELAQAVAVVWPSSTGADVVEWAAGERSGSVRSGRAGPGELPAPVVAALRGQETDAPLLPDHLADAPWADTAPWPADRSGASRGVDGGGRRGRVASRQRRARGRARPGAGRARPGPPRRPATPPWWTSSPSVRASRWRPQRSTPARCAPPACCAPACCSRRCRGCPA